MNFSFTLIDFFFLCVIEGQPNFFFAVSTAVLPFLLAGQYLHFKVGNIAVFFWKGNQLQRARVKSEKAYKQGKKQSFEII
jgi:hypothetical protein